MNAKVTPEMVKELRERTGVGVAKCKEALDQAQGDMEQAIDNLRKAGMASAVKKEGRETNEGLIGIAESKDAIALVEMNAETDFVTQNEKFKQFLHDVALDAAEMRPDSLEAFLKQPFSKDKSVTIDQHRALVMHSLGENIQMKKLLIIQKTREISVGFYSHMGGKIVALTILTGGTGQEALARDIAMHIAAESPAYLSPDDVPQEMRIREEDIARSQVQGKSEEIANKIIQGKYKAYCDEMCLLCQKYIKDNAITIAHLLEKENKRLGKAMAIQKFYRWRVGA